MIKLYTDTAANLPKSIIEEYSIKVVPFEYSINGRDAEVTDDFDGKKFYAAMRAGASISTRLINIVTFMESFEESLQNGDDVMYIGMSGGISGTANAALIAASELKKRYPERLIASIDTYAASLGEGMLVIEAAKKLKSGASFAETENYIVRKRKNMCQFFTVDDLEYLKRGGRVSGVAALVGNLLNIKPMLKGDNQGHIVLCDKIRGYKKVLDALAEKYRTMVTDKSADIGIAHADNEDGTDYLLRKLTEYGFVGKPIIQCYEPVTGSHVGPGTVALFFFGKSR